MKAEAIALTVFNDWFSYHSIFFKINSKDESEKKVISLIKY